MPSKKVNSKWKKGNARYSPAEREVITRKYREASDFHKGARIRRVEGQRRAA